VICQGSEQITGARQRSHGVAALAVGLGMGEVEAPWILRPSSSWAWSPVSARVLNLLQLVPAGEARQRTRSSLRTGDGRRGTADDADGGKMEAWRRKDEFSVYDNLPGVDKDDVEQTAPTTG
jgi:hypothetical protein